MRRLAWRVSGVCLLAAALPADISARSAGPERIRIDVRFSKQLAVFRFVQQLSPRAPANPFKTAFAASPFANSDHAAMLAAFDSIPLEYEYKFDYPEGKIEGSTEYVLRRNLITADSPDDFRARSIGVVPMADLNGLLSILEAFTPAYDSLIYNPNRARFDQQLREIETLVTTKDIPRAFGRTAGFFRTPWDPSIPFVLVFYPWPVSRGFSATAYGNIAESPLPTGTSDYTNVLALTLQEAAHILLDEQSRDFMQTRNGWYAESPARSRHYAKALMQESWATAVYGYFTEELSGHLNPGRWYGVGYIDVMGKEVFALIKPYLDAGRPMDKALVDAYVHIYETKFLSWLSEWDNLLMGRAVMSDRTGDFELLDRKFPYANIKTYVRDFSDASFEKVQAANTTTLIVISSDNSHRLELVKSHCGELAGWRPDAKRDFTHAVFTADGRRLIVVNLVNRSFEEQLQLKLDQP